MGFRSRRHKGGGGGGGGGGGHGGGGGQAFAWTGEANGLQPGDDVGNRKSFKPVVVPPDDIGNRRDPDEEEDVPFDDVGNRIDANPTHEVSGVLLDLDPKKRKRRAKGTQAPIERNGRYVVGGVNPIIAGGNRPPPPMPEESFEPQQQQQPREPRGQQQQQPQPQQQPREPRVQQQQPQQQQQPRAEKKRRFEQVDGNAAQEVSEKRAQRFFDFDEDDRFEYTLKSTPERKRKEALRFVDDILRECGRNANVHARVIEDGDKPKLLVTIEEKGPHARVDRLGDGANEPLFVMGNGALLSLNYLANKVVNRYPDDRIRLAVLPASDEPLYLESLDEHHKRKRAEAEGAPLATQPVAVLVQAPVVVEPEAPALVAPVEAKTGGRRRKPASAAGADVVELAVEVDAPIVVAPIVEAPIVEAPIVVVPAAAPVPAPAVAMEVDDDVPAKKAPRRKPKKSEEIIPPMVTPPPAAVAVAVAAPVAPAAPPAVAEPVALAAEPEEARGRRRAPPLDDLPSRPRPGMNDDPLGRGPPRGRPRRGPSMVEVVRVTKKT